MNAIPEASTKTPFATDVADDAIVVNNNAAPGTSEGAGKTSAL